MLLSSPVVVTAYRKTKPSPACAAKSVTPLSLNPIKRQVERWLLPMAQGIPTKGSSRIRTASHQGDRDQFPLRFSASASVGGSRWSVFRSGILCLLIPLALWQVEARLLKRWPLCCLCSPQRETLPWCRRPTEVASGSSSAPAYPLEERQLVSRLAQVYWWVAVSRRVAVMPMELQLAFP